MQEVITLPKHLFSTFIPELGSCLSYYVLSDLLCPYSSRFALWYWCCALLCDIHAVAMVVHVALCNTHLVYLEFWFIQRVWRTHSICSSWSISIRVCWVSLEWNSSIIVIWPCWYYSLVNSPGGVVDACRVRSGGYHQIQTTSLNVLMYHIQLGNPLGTLAMSSALWLIRCVK